MNDLLYSTYWNRKQLLATSVPHFPIRRWWLTDSLCDIEQTYFDAIQNASRVLDVGAGDLRIKNKFLSAGYRGDYHTQDIGTEYSHTFRDLSDVKEFYDGIICFDVIEHMSLESGLNLVSQLASLISPGGVLLLQTPNGRCVRNPLSWDMTHVHLYSLPDLWALLTTWGFQVQGYRVVFQSGPQVSLAFSFKFLVQKLVTTQILGVDYADNISIVARRV